VRPSESVSHRGNGRVQSDEYQGLGYAAKWERLALREHSVTYGDDSEQQEDWGFA